MTRQESLIAEGWERRFVACEPRLSEAAALYRELGQEVHLEPLPNKLDEAMMGTDCDACFEGDRDRYRIFYTRPPRSAPADSF